MCDPLTASAVIAGVATVAETASTVVAETKAANAQAKAINNQLKVTTEESRKQATDEIFDQMRATRREQARTRAAAGEAGLSTDSANIEDLLMDSAMQGQMSGARSIANMESRNDNYQAEATSQMSKVQKPTALGAGIQIGAAAASAWNGIQSAKITAARAKKA